LCFFWATGFPLGRLIDETTAKKTDNMERCIQSLEDKLKIANSKKVKGDGTKSKSNLKKGTPSPRRLQPTRQQQPHKGSERLRRQQQQCQIQQTKIKRERTKSLIWWEEGRYKHQLAQIDCAIEKETRTNFRFIPDINISIHLNARIVLGNTTTAEYFNHITNKRFYDLTTGNLIPTAAASLKR
jgi:hypothetical protein